MHRCRRRGELRCQRCGEARHPKDSSAVLANSGFEILKCVKRKTELMAGLLIPSRRAEFGRGKVDVASMGGS